MPAAADSQATGGQASAGIAESVQFVDEPIVVEYDGARFDPGR